MAVITPLPHGKYLIRQADLANKFSMSVDALRKLAKNDPTFPSQIKCGTTRQAAVYYAVNDIEIWIKSKRAQAESTNTQLIKSK